MNKGHSLPIKCRGWDRSEQERKLGSKGHSQTVGHSGPAQNSKRKPATKGHSLPDEK
jgi:hypothetical protein